MFKIFISIYSFLGLFYIMSYQFYSYSERRTLLTILILSAVVVLIVGPSLSAKKRKKTMENVVQKDIVDGEYHNDFSRVGSAEDYDISLKDIQVKPVDLSGNAIEHARVQLNEDLRIIENPQIKVDSDKNS